MEQSTNGTTNSTSRMESLRIGKIKGASIQVHWSFFLLLAFNMVLAILSSKNMLRVMLYSFLYWGPMVFISIFIHELGHAIVTWRLGGEIDRMVLTPIGGLTFFTATEKGHVGDLKVALAGPLIQIPFMCILAAIYLILQTEKTGPFVDFYATYENVSGTIGLLFLTLCRTTFWYNVLLLSINLLVPIYPLDGLRIYAATLKIMGINLTTTAKFVSIGGMIFSVSLFGFGVFKLFHTSYIGGMSEVLAGGLGFTNSKILFDLVKAGRLKEDPIFGRRCYEQSTNESVEMASTSNNTLPTSEMV